MSDPTFRLEGVVHERDSLADFEGPLSLILQLLSKNKIEIRDISVSEILDQYLAYLDEMQRMDLEVASEFVQMAAYLLYIKTRTLLAADKEVTELEQLMSSLEQLKAKGAREAVKSVLEQFGAMSENGKDLFTRAQEPLSPAAKVYDYRHEPSELLCAESKSRSEVVAVFLSILELCSMGSLSITERGADLVLEFTGGDTEKILEAIEED